MEETQLHRRPQHREAPAVRRRPQPRQPGHWKRRLAIVGAVVLGLVLVAAVLIWQRAAAFNDAVSSEPMLSSALWSALWREERVNILLLGFADEDRPGAFLSDSISILSIQPASETTTAIPIPRDLWIEDVDQISGNGKINQAFADGHAEGGYRKAGTNSTALIESITGLRIHGWLALDFRGFRGMVEAVNGVTVDNPRSFSWAWDGESFAAGVVDGTFESGRIELDGQSALAYVRVRHTTLPEESSDFARSARQHRVLAAIRDKIGDGGLGSVGVGLQLADTLQGRLHTNLSAVDLYLLSSHLAPESRIELAEGVILEATRNSAGSYVLVVIGRDSPGDYGPLRSFIAEELKDGTP